MKAISKITIGVIGTLALFTSCEKEIPYKGDNQESVLVINEIMEKDSTIIVQLERSVFFLDNSNVDVIINGADVSVTDVTTGITESTNASVDGVYEFGMISQEGHEYNVSVTHPDYPMATAKTFIPMTVALSSVDTLTSSNVDPSFGNQSMDGTLTWTDPIGEDFYIVAVNLVDIAGYRSRLWLTANDLSIQNGESDGLESGVYGNFFGISDDTFEGGTKSLKVNFYKGQSSEVDFYEFQLFRCTEDAYRYLISTNTSQFSDPGPFTEPIKVHSNVVDGLGIFAGVNKSVIIKYD